MKWSEWFEKWSMTSLKVNVGVLKMNWEPKDDDKNAAWELYIELLTRVTTQSLPKDSGDEEKALDSIHQIFPLTREVIKRNGRGSVSFTRIAIIVLNQVIRPFTAKWHKELLNDSFKDENKCKEFRSDLFKLQPELIKYSKMLADMAGVEDMTALEEK